MYQLTQKLSRTRQADTQNRNNNHGSGSYVAPAPPSKDHSSRGFFSGPNHQSSNQSYTSTSCMYSNGTNMCPANYTSQSSATTRAPAKVSATSGAPASSVSYVSVPPGNISQAISSTQHTYAPPKLPSRSSTHVPSPVVPGSSSLPVQGMSNSKAAAPTAALPASAQKVGYMGNSGMTPSLTLAPTLQPVTPTVAPKDTIPSPRTAPRKQRSSRIQTADHVQLEPLPSLSLIHI